MVLFLFQYVMKPYDGSIPTKPIPSSLEKSDSSGWLQTIELFDWEWIDLSNIYSIQGYGIDANSSFVY